MKTCLFSLSYLDGRDGFGNSRLERQKRYIDYYLSIKSEIGFSEIHFCDNASSKENVVLFESFTRNKPVSFHRFKEHLPRGLGYSMPYAWRGLDYLKILIAQGYKKIICVDSDCFILTKRLANFIKYTNHGWYSFFSSKYKWPTAELHVLCKDQFDRYLGFTAIPQARLDGLCMEKTLPFTDIYKSFTVDRFGEDGLAQDENQDAYGQAHLDTHLEFNKYGI